jgi:hypothetical protein
MANACITLLSLAEASFSSHSQGGSRITVTYASLYLALLMSLNATVISAYDAVNFQSARISEDGSRRSFVVNATVVLRAVPFMFLVAIIALQVAILLLVWETQPGHVCIMMAIISQFPPVLWLFSLARWCVHYFA